MFADMQFSKRLFLKKVFYLSWISFGGPQAHYLLFEEHFLKKINWIHRADYQELFALCQILPGPSSTQLLTLLAYKKGGTKFSLYCLFIWAFPACLLMGLFSFLIPFVMQQYGLDFRFFAFLIPFVLGLLLVNIFNYSKQHIKSIEDKISLALLTLLFICFYATPWIFISILCLSFIVHYKAFRNKKKVVTDKINVFKKRFLIVFVSVFLVAGFLSEQARIHEWQYRKPFNLFENSYRFGSTVFGGGNVLSSMMYEQYAVRSKTKYIDKQEALIGMALSQATPGPVFSYATFIGGLIFYKQSWQWQIFGCLIATIGIFLPGFLISIFCFQIWSYLKKYAFFSPAIHAVHLSVSVILFGTFIYLYADNKLYEWQFGMNILQSIYIFFIAFMVHKKLLNSLILFILSLVLGGIYGLL